jgi:hypothetical protein
MDKTRSFDLNTQHVLATSPKGLGNAFSTSYKESANGRHLTNVRPSFPDIELTIYVNADATDGVANYKSLANFLATVGKSPFLFQYDDGINQKFCEVVSKELPRSNEDDSGVFAETFKFERQSYWYEEMGETFALKKSAQDMAFPLAFPLAFDGVYFQNEYKITNSFYEPAPVDITISGNIADNIDIYIDTADTRQRVAELQLSVNNSDGTVIRIIPTPNKKITMTTDGITTSRYDITDKTKDSFLYVPFGTYIIGCNMVPSDTGRIEMTIRRYLFD